MRIRFGATLWLGITQFDFSVCLHIRQILRIWLLFPILENTGLLLEFPHDVENINILFLFFKILFKNFIYFNWRLIILQYCNGFCHTLTWISHGCPRVPYPEPPSHLPPHPIPLIKPGLAIYFTYDNIQNINILNHE